MPTTAIAWRPDGRGKPLPLIFPTADATPTATPTVLAVGQKDGMVGVYNVEDGNLLNHFEAGSAILNLHWAKMAGEEEK